MKTIVFNETNISGVYAMEQAERKGHRLNHSDAGISIVEEVFGFVKRNAQTNASTTWQVRTNSRRSNVEVRRESRL